MKKRKPKTPPSKKVCQGNSGGRWACAGPSDFGEGPKGPGHVGTGPFKKKKKGGVNDVWTPGRQWEGSKKEGKLYQAGGHGGNLRGKKKPEERGLPNPGVKERKLD